LYRFVSPRGRSGAGGSSVMPNADGEPVYLNGRDFQHKLAPGGLAGLRLSLVGRPARQLEVLAPIRASRLQLSERAIAGTAATRPFGALPFRDSRWDGAPVGLGNSCPPVGLCERPTSANRGGAVSGSGSLPGSTPARTWLDSVRQPGQAGRAAVLLDYVLRPAGFIGHCNVRSSLNPAGAFRTSKKRCLRFGHGRHRQLSQRLSALSARSSR
jgi:hypothetical protein